MKPRIRLVSIAFLVAPLVVADEPAKPAPKPKAAISISGRGGGPITVTDKRDPNATPAEVVPRPVNQSSPQAQERAAAARAAAEEATRQRREAREAEKKAIEDQIAADTEAKNADKGKDEKKELTPEEGLKLLREKNYITYTEDDKHYPKVVFDPFGKEFIPTEEAIKRLQNPPQPGVPGGKPTTP